MTTTEAEPTTSPAVPDEATRAEWHALVEASTKVHDKADHERGMVALYMIDHLAAGGLAPAAYGLPSEKSLVAYRRACEHAEMVLAHDTTCAELRAQIEAHPFQLHLEQLRADKES